MKYGGKHLIEMGFEPSSWFGKAIREIESLDNPSPEKVFEIAERIELLSRPFEYSKENKELNISLASDSIYERTNYNKITEIANNLLEHPRVAGIDILPDACPSGDKYTIPVGGVASIHRAIIPEMHSADIACSMYTSYLLEEVFDFSNWDRVEEILGIIFKAVKATVHFGHGVNTKIHNKFSLSDIFKDRIKNNSFTADLIGLAQTQLGTQGDGNHFTTVGYSLNKMTPVIVTHQGSRGLGAQLFKKGNQLARRETGLRKNAFLDIGKNYTEEYLEALNIAYAYSYINHKTIHEAIFKELKYNSKYTEKYFNTHNMVARDEFMEDIYYHAKGSTFMYKAGKYDTHHKTIPLNMRDPILICRQRNDVTGNPILFAPHGAGRLISRSDFLEKHKNNLATLFKEETKGIQYHPYLGQPDYTELPSAYKEYNKTVQEISEFVEIVDMIQPFGTIMAGREIKLN